MFLTIGYANECEKVTCLWNGLDKEIQSELWWDKLNPNGTLWNEVLHAAQHHEQATWIREGWYLHCDTKRPLNNRRLNI